MRDEQRAVEDQIREAFKGVTREGGVSWSEAVVIDDYGSPEERTVARSKDVERSWEDLVDNPDWREDPGIGGFCFVDAIGWRYYIAPAMIRCTRQGYGEFVGYALERPRTGVIALLDAKQSRAIARFVRFMIAVHEAMNDHVYGQSWHDAYRTDWRRFEI